MEKIKQFIESEKGKDILIVIIVILTGLGSFELGRLSKEANSSGIKIEYGDQQEANAISSIEPISATFNNSQTNNIISNSGKNFFASSRGTKYYSLGCSAGKTIKQENRVYFTTGEEAQRAGYMLSASCQ
ncbi:hypothetical protein A3F97_03300 [Candidatus Nomurabacteria bacterium RIFCSPLOWO2_12_FULL_41_10]|uniref:Ada DNA repair metal-binding domain-containing protein n=2 Tax=Candidatus Nomuraibacteriota TaxID=1752729 RepID=A0A1F6YAV3_9BACT|nr:MAG: hypothetical protein A3F49_02785 [Candidatus Nomurabacteria bacterium RIFCSPHIGHO2_12_FULL_42_19]OGI93613.1 MAG: hypothetical protein A3A07_01125 [Candidatus Nomurabacteria bacterium RIFCSPLOWO2_01_FULL_41_52]OGI99318.1 MAG: hypothetical protein A3H56_03590 [Candidatus Nomurabacteria bacterium RIFCSPLOWO2_02_FULL_42_24]OGJ03457.1 MAG: hypothetical protein A3F97_03300 [Candidatus Nomurabacteria bacterium RIFCSPLOWO2_12_FULL_41_10]